MGRSVNWVNERLNLVALDPWIQANRLHPKTTDQQAPPLRLKVAAKLGGIDVPDINTLRRVAAELNHPIEPHINPEEDERRLIMQRLFLMRIETYNLGTTAATHLIEKVLSGGRPGGGASNTKIIRRAKRPSKMRERLTNMAREMSEQSVFSWDSGDFGHAFEGASPEWAAGVLEDLEMGIEQMTELAERLKLRFPTITNQFDD